MKTNDEIMSYIKNHLKLSIKIFFTILLGASALVAQSQLPKAEVRQVTNEYFGQKITDSYRWMENSKSDETQKWMRGQADYADAYLKKLPLREELLKEFNQISDVGTRVGGIQRRGNRYFYTRRAPNESDFSVYVRDGLGGAERILVDPKTFSGGGKRFSVSSFSPSPDGKLLAFLISAGGGEFGEIRVLDVGSGKETGDRIEKTRWSAGEWLPDGKSFLYAKFQTLAPDAPPTEAYQKLRVFRHALGTAGGEDKAVFGYEVNPNVKLETAPIPFIQIPRGSKYAFAIVNSGVSPNSDVYAAPIDALDQNPIPWRKIINLEDEVANLEVRGDEAFLLTYKNASRYKITRVNLKNPDLKNAETVFPAGEAVVENMTAAKDALYVQTLDGGTRKIHRVDYQTKQAQPIKLPYPGSASLSTNPFDLDAGVYFNLDSWTKSSAHFVYDPQTQTATDTKLVPPIQIAMDDIEIVNVRVKSHDGVGVPLVIAYKKGLQRGGVNPVLMDGYGAYGIENTSPYFAPNILPWLNRGGIIASAGIRGGGEYGEEWHLAGKGATKPNTWKDFIACAEYLIAEKYTSPKHLGIIGGSAGGILISNAITERPDLFGAAISAVGLNNALLAETTANGVPNIPEFGTFKTEAGFKELLAMDGYYKVKDEVKYPAVLLTHGINDPRVEPWMSAKMAARLQAATKSGKPVLLRLDYDAGHGAGSTKEQRNREAADVYAFLFEQLGGARK